MRKYISWIIVAAVIFSIFFVNWFKESNNNPLDYARITEVDYKAVVTDEPGGDGKVVITERLTFDIHAASKDNLFWELWRDLPEGYVDGVKVDYKVNAVKQILDDGTVVEYEQSPRLYWSDYDFINTSGGYGPGKWFHSEGPYNEDLRQYECVLFYVDGLYREKVVFEIEYEMRNAALRYNDCSELYISLYSGSSIKYLESFKGQILVPDEIMPREGNYEAHTYGTNSNIFPFDETDRAHPGYHTFVFELDESQLKFRPYNQYIEFTLISHGKDKHIFTQYATENYYYDDDVLDEIYAAQAEYEAVPGNYMIAKIVVLLLLSAAAVLAVRFAFKAREKLKKKYHFYEPAMQMDYFRDIPSELDPNFAAALVFCKQKQPDDTKEGYAAVMLSLVRKGYIDLDRIRQEYDWDFNNVKIVVKYRTMQPQWVPERQQYVWTPAQTLPDVKPLTPTEEQYFSLIIRHSNGLDLPLSAFQQRVSEDFEYTNSFAGNVKKTITNVGVSQGYFQKADYKEPVKQVRGWAMALGVVGALVMVVGNLASYQTRLDLAFGAFFILGIGFLISAAYLFKTAAKFVLLTQFGEDEYVKWHGLYNFLNSATLMNERTVIELAIWELYLVYATAFGISDKVIAAINIRCPHVETSPVLSNPYYRSVHFYTSGRTFRTATRSAAFRASASASGGYGGGYGGHGGYGGGGRGGGGGGGGH